MQDFIDKGIMKCFVVDGIVMCSYRTIKVSQTTGSLESVKIEKDFFFNPLIKSMYYNMCVVVFRLYYDQAATKLLWV